MSLKKSKKIVVFAAVLAAVIICTVVLTGAFSAYGAPKTIPAGTSPAQTNTVNDRPNVTWEALRKYAEGSLSYSDIRDTFYYKEIGSGLYIISFPIKAAPGFSLVASSASPKAAPASVGLRCEPVGLSLNLNEENLDIMMEMYNDGGLEKDEQAVRALVEAFGKTLRTVSLSAAKDAAAASIEENYRSFVTPELLQKWKADPQSAPGRMVSSPWPDRIDILNMEINDRTRYTVQGEIIEVTSVEMENGGAAARRPVTLTVRKVNGRWLIDGVTMGEYVQHGPVAYENTRYGFRFYLPETWKGYSIVEEQWKGTKDGELVETGPQLLIRHPDWTSENPRQDIPIMIFTQAQWNALQKEEFFISAAPIGPSKLGGNSAYVFALPPRYNFAFLPGYEEVEEILKGNPLWPIKPSGEGDSFRENNPS